VERLTRFFAPISSSSTTRIRALERPPARRSSKHGSTFGWLLTTVLVVLFAQLALAGAAMADGPDPKEPALVEEPLSFVVDESLEPIGGQKGVATVADPHGKRSDFAADELIVVTDDGKTLEGLLERRKGNVLSSFDPAEYGFDELRARHLVRIDTSDVDTERLTSDLESLGVDARGGHRVSSREALGLIAVAAAEAVDGMTVGFNWLVQGTTIRTRSTTEAPLDDMSITPAYTRDAYQWAHLANGTTQDTGIGEAWNLLARANRLPAPGAGIRIGILDNGFAPFDPDIPGGSIQLSNGASTIPCFGGVACPFHGSNVTSTAMALVDNSFGAAGSGGPVARAIQLNTGASIFTVESGLLNLQSRGARIINMSFGGSIPYALGGFNPAFFDVTADAVRARGTLLVASAGNAGIDVDTLGCFIACWEAAYNWPCETTGVLCVGGLNTNSKAPFPSSNFESGRNHAGSGTVDIWAPWFAVSAVDPSDAAFAADPNTAKSFPGTSASAPVVSGVAALVMAARPGLTAAQVETTLLSTAQPGTGGATLTLDAQAAVTSALLPNLPPDVRIVQPASGSQVARGYVQFSATASDREDGMPTVRWFADSIASGTTYSLGQGTNVTLTTHHLAFGTYTIRAVATDSGNQSVPDADGGIAINLINTAPSVGIGQPTNGGVYYIYRNRLQGGWSGDTINLAGTSWDLNNSPGTLPDQLVYWTRNGLFLTSGHVGSVNALALGVGTHTITFRGRDAEGLWAVDKSVTIEVQEWRPKLICLPGTICG
jgi:serine protease